MKKILLALGLICSLMSFSQISVKINDSIIYQEIVGFGWHGAMDVWWGSGPFYNTTYLNNCVDDVGMTMNRNNFHAYDMSVYNNKQKTYFTALKDKAAASNEPMFFINTVWSPPIEWKANNKVCDNTCSSKCNAQFDLSPTCAGTTNYLLPQYYDDYVNFCADWIKNTLGPETGTTPYAFSLQNESAFNEPYESCKYTPEQYKNLLNVAGPIFRSKCPNVKLFGPEDMGSAGTTAGWTGVIFNDTNAVKYLDVIAVHGYSDGVNASSGDATGWSQMYANANSKKKQLWMTETSGYSSTWTASNGAFDVVKAMYLALKYGKISAWTWWQFGSTTMTSDKIYYVFKSYYRYIRPYAVQVESSSADKDVYVMAFKNPGTSAYSAVKPQLTVILINSTTSSKTVNLSGRGVPATMKAYRTSSSENCVTLADATTSSVTLPSQSITTLVYQSTNKGPTITQPKDLVFVKNQAKTVSLTNVTNGEGTQTNLTLSAISDNKTLFPSALSVSAGTGSNYNLTLNPATDKTGTSIIKLFVKDGSTTDALNTTVVQFTVKVIPFVNVAPNIDVIKDVTCGLNNKNLKHRIYFTGVNDGNDGSQTISKPVVTFSDATKLRLPYVNYTSPQTGGNLEFYPDALGTTTVTMNIQDNGGTDLGGKDMKTITFKITVVDSYQFNGMYDEYTDPLIVYPNPASDHINVELPSSSYREISIYDLTGKQVKTLIAVSELTNIYVGDLNTGMYVVVAKGDNNIAKAKFSITR